MKKALMIMAMVAVIGLAGANSAMAWWFFPVNGTDLDFFNGSNWARFHSGPAYGYVPGAGNDGDAIQAGGYSTWSGSVLYDPANQSPADEAGYTIGDNPDTEGGRTAHSFGGWSGAVYNPYAFIQASGNLTWGPNDNFQFQLQYEGAYEMNAGTATFGRNLELWNPDPAAWTWMPAPVNNLFDHNGGDVVVDETLHIGVLHGGSGPGTCVYTIADGTLQTEVLTIGANSALNFDAASTGVVYVNTSDKTEAGIEALITAGDITLGGAAAVPADFEITEGMGPGGAYTEVKLPGGGGAAVPEPAGLGLLGVALLAVRRKRS